MNTLELDRLYTYFNETSSGPESEDMKDFIIRLQIIQDTMAKLYGTYDQTRVDAIRDETQCNFEVARRADVLFSGDVDMAIAYIKKMWDPEKLNVDKVQLRKETSDSEDSTYEYNRLMQCSGMDEIANFPPGQKPVFIGMPDKSDEDVIKPIHYCSPEELGIPEIKDE